MNDTLYDGWAECPRIYLSWRINNGQSTNSLPDSLKHINLNLQTFKRHIKTFLSSTYEHIQRVWGFLQKRAISYKLKSTVINLPAADNRVTATITGNMLKTNETTACRPRWTGAIRLLSVIHVWTPMRSCRRPTRSTSPGESRNQ